MHTRDFRIPLCRHTKTNGRLCNTPALVDSAFCYHHQKLHATRRATISAGPNLSRSVLHPLRNAESIRQALAMVLTALAANRIHPKKATKMLYALQLASSDLRKNSME